MYLDKVTTNRKLQVPKIGKERKSHLSKKLSPKLLMQISPLLLIAVGAFLAHLYLYNVPGSSPFPINLFFLGIFLQSVGVTITLLPMLGKSKRKINKGLFLICVFALSISVCYMRATRFDVIMGGDVLREVKSAKPVWSAKRWDPYLSSPGLLTPIHKYSSCLSVTVLPTIVGELLGLDDIEQFFRFFIPLQASLFFLFVFLVMHDFFGNSLITYLTTALVPQMFFFPRLLDLTRGLLPLIFMWLLIHLLHKRTSKSYLLSSIFILGIVSSHYTVSYFTAFLLAILLVAPWGFRKLAFFLPKTYRSEVKWFSWKFLIIFFVITLLWLTYMAIGKLSLHVQQVHTLLSRIISSFNVSARRAETGYLLVSPRGPITTAWMDIQFAMMAVGGLLGLLGSFRKKISPLRVVWVLAGSSILGLILVIAFVPYVSLDLQIDRTMCHYAPFLCSFMAFVLAKLKDHARPLVILFLLLVLPMNMFLPSHQGDIMFHFTDELTPSQLLDSYSSSVVPSSGKAVGQWINNYQQFMDGTEGEDPSGIGRMEPLTLDSMGYCTMLITNISTQNTFRTSHPDFMREEAPGPYSTRLRYMLIHYFYIEYGLWSRPKESPITYQAIGEFSTQPGRNITSSTLFQDVRLNIVYRNNLYAYIHREGDRRAYCSWEIFEDE